jgi:hypothetical protein
MSSKAAALLNNFMSPTLSLLFGEVDGGGRSARLRTLQSIRRVESENVFVNHRGEGFDFLIVGPDYVVMSLAHGNPVFGTRKLVGEIGELGVCLQSG